MTTDQQLDQRLRRLQAGLVKRLDRLSGSYLAGTIDARTLQEQARSALRASHAKAAYLGRLRAGERGQFSVDDVRDGHRIMQAEAKFLAGFVRDLQAGIYDRKAQGGRGAQVRRSRWALYALKLTGTANAAWAESLPGETLVTWNLGGGDHCTDCPGYAAGSPYTAASLPTTPGSGDSQCLSRCGCWLTYDGGVSFRAGAGKA